MKYQKVDKIIIIVGPTASGKSSLGVSMAKKLNGEIISADSRQVYRRMDIGTGKVSRDQRLTTKAKKYSNPSHSILDIEHNYFSSGIRHHLLDVASPKKQFSVAEFKKLALGAIKDIVERGKTPVIVGGTGFWVDSLIYDWPLPEIKANKKLRARLDKNTAEQLFSRLKKLDPARAKIIDRYNKRRLVRAIEIVTATGRKIPVFSLQKNYGRKDFVAGNKKLKIKIIGLNPPKEILEQKIHKRLISRLNEDMVKEVRELHKLGAPWKRLDDFGLEYRFISRYLRGLINYDEMVEQTYGAIKKYAKRQMTWFKRNKNIEWFKSQKDALRYVIRIYPSER